MMTLTARLCALCAVGALMQMMFDREYQESLRMIGGLLMLHLVLCSVVQMLHALSDADGLMHIFEIIMA